MLALPYHGHRAWVRAFWLAMALWAGLVVGVVVPFGPAERAVAAALAAVLVGAVPVVRYREARTLYRLGVRASRLYARLARFALLALCYGIIFVAVGAAGSALRLRRPAPGDSLWEAGRTLPPGAYRSQHGAESPGTRRRWRAILDWATDSGNAWALTLVPFLLLVAALDTEDEAPYPVGIYTLF
jgi:hypothetical protein